MAKDPKKSSIWSNAFSDIYRDDLTRLHEVVIKKGYAMAAFVPQTPSDAWTALQNSIFEIGGQDQLEKIRNDFPKKPKDEEEKKSINEKFYKTLQDAHVRIGTLLKSDGVSFLLGAGASKEAGGVLLGTIPKEIEKELLSEGVLEGKVKEWLKLFYVGIFSYCPKPSEIPLDEKKIILRKKKINELDELNVNLEDVLSLFYRWKSVLSHGSTKFHLEDPVKVTINLSDVNDCIQNLKKALTKHCQLPTAEFSEESLGSYRAFLKKILTRPLNLKRINVFTLNYDTMVEQAGDSEGVVLLDGFVGTVKKVFRPEVYDQDLYFPADTTEGRVHRFDRVLHLYKLHGSINWKGEEPSWDNPYGVSVSTVLESDQSNVLIYPTPTKQGEILGMPYSELFRRFASAVVRPQSTLFVIGYGFGDKHVNAIIRQALAVPSFTLVIIDPKVAKASDGGFVGQLRSLNDKRAWILSGKTLGSFSSFIKLVLPDLRDQDVLKTVMATFNSLKPSRGSLPAGDFGNAE